MRYDLPDLPYEYNALEPYIDTATMTLHHDKHHSGYVAKLNAALESVSVPLPDTLEGLMGGLSSLPESIRTAVRNNGGGHYNHSLFWKLLQPGGGSGPGKETSALLKSAFGGEEAFREAFSKAALGLFGSGWTWLALEEGNRAVIVTTPNQDNPLMSGQKPLLGLDVWEHAYYLKYQNRRAEYIDAFWNLINWSEVEKRLQR